jgi:hypothetical protein
MNSPKRLARLAGALYLAVGVLGGFAEGFVEPAMYVRGDAAATAHNLVTNTALVRLGVVADLADQVVFVILALVLAALLRHVHRGAARAMAVLVVLAAAVASLNVAFEYAGLQVATGAVDLSSLGTGGSHALALLLLDTQHYGLLAAQGFFGAWLVPLGYLALKSGWFPKALGVLLVVAGGCYLADVMTAFLLPEVARTIHPFLVIPCVTIAEVWMVFYLLIVGVRTNRSVEPVERVMATA